MKARKAKKLKVLPKRRVTRRKVHRSDSNAKGIISCARQMGALVEVIGRPVDLLVGIGGDWYLVEVKAPKGAYTDDQRLFMAECAHQKLPLLTWRSVQDAEIALNAIRKRMGIIGGSSMTDSIDVPE